MCGFVGLFDIRRKSDALRGQVLKMSKQIRHRGPDWSGVYCGERAILSHERLSIVDPQSGGQPLFSCDGKQVLAVNGEIYNHQEIRAELAGEYDFRTGSDCEVILPLYRKLGVGLLEKISGIFAFALYDIEKDEYLIARDPVSVQNIVRLPTVHHANDKFVGRNFFFLPICVLPEIAADTVERGAFAEGILVTQTKIHAVQFVLAFQILIFCSCIPDGSHNLAANGSKIHAR